MDEEVKGLCLSLVTKLYKLTSRLDLTVYQKLQLFRMDPFNIKYL